MIGSKALEIAQTVSEPRMSHRSAKLLFLAHPFPPCPASGSIRTWNIVRSLVRLQWDVTVVTPHPSIWRYPDDPAQYEARVRREGIRRILTGHGWRCLVPNQVKCRNSGLSWVAGGICRRVARRLGVDSGSGWVGAAERACAALVPADVDVILATGSPFASFTLAKRLSDKLCRPYVLDYRDPWTGNPHVDDPVRPAMVRQEAELLRACAAVTIVSPSWASAMRLRFDVSQKLHVITNGYEAEEIDDVQPYHFGHFAIVYTGNFYPPKRIVSPIMAALKHVRQTINHEWFFHYYGAQEHHVTEEARRFGVLDRVLIHGRVPRAQALSAVRGADVAVVITSVADTADREEKGIVPGKVFETIGLGRPILLIAPPDSDIEALAETTGLARRFAGSDISGISSFLADAMSGSVPQMKHRDMYAWASIGRDFDSVLRSIASQGSSRMTSVMDGSTLAR